MPSPRSILLSIGVDRDDDEELRLRKLLVLSAALMVAPMAALWGLIYWLFGAQPSALVPWSYTVLTLVTIAIFARDHRYRWFAATHFVVFLVLPFLLMWSLGGIVAGSIVALWAWLSPLAARTIGHRRASFALFACFGAGIAASVVIGDRVQVSDPLPDGVVAFLFVLNVVVVGAISLVLVDGAAGGREGSLSSMRGVVRRYFSSDVADAILADPERQALGGELADVSILFADLGGYTTFSDGRSPHDVVALLNDVFAAALPAIAAEGGTTVQLPGDAVMAIFGAPRPAPDHAARAARAALAIQARHEAAPAGGEGRPRFRIGINSGEALVGNIGSDEFRNFTAIGDTVNMAQRLGTLAEPGQVVTGASTAERLDDSFAVEWLPEVSVKGKRDLVRPCVLRAATAPGEPAGEAGVERGPSRGRDIT